MLAGMKKLRSTSSREAEIRQLLAEQERSGQTVGAFARAKRMSAQTLYWWRSELRRRARRGKQRVADLVAVTVTGGDVAELDVELGDDIRIRVPRGFSSGDLARLLGVLRAC